MLDDVTIRELDEAVAAHQAWLASKKVDVPVPAAGLTALEVLLLIDEAKPRTESLDEKRVAAVMASLVRLLRFRARAVGLERFLDENKKWRNELVERKRNEGAGRAEIAKLKRDFKAIDAAHDEEAVLLVEARGQEVQKRMRSYGAALTAYMTSLAKRQGTFRVAGYGAARLLAPTRQNLAVAFMREQLSHLSLEIDWLSADARGTAATEPLGHVGDADAKAWHRLRGECLLQLQEAGIAGRVRSALFPSTNPEPARAKSRNEKRVSRAKTRAKVDT